jgi:hypothetical protein
MTNNSRKNELINNNWIQVCKFYKNTSGQYKFIDINEILSDDIQIDNLNVYFLKIYESVANDPQVLTPDTCIITKFDGLYQISLFDKNVNIDKISFTKSTWKPLSVSYNHPDLHVPIDLIIPNEMYCVDNCIFSKIFIFRCLVHQDNFFIFDERYSLTIIDEDVNIHKLSSNEYIKITETGMVIIPE